MEESLSNKRKGEAVAESEAKLSEVPPTDTSQHNDITKLLHHFLFGMLDQKSITLSIEKQSTLQ